MKRHLTSVLLVLALAAFLVCGYFVSKVFVDILMLIIAAGAAYEMFRCLRQAGYKMLVLPLAFTVVAAYPTYYLTEYYLGLGVEGLLAVFMLGALAALTCFTFMPAKKEACIIENANCGGDKAQNAADVYEAQAADKEQTMSAECGEAQAAENKQTTSTDNEQTISAHNSEDAKIAQAGGGTQIGERAMGLKDLFANIFVLVYPVLFLALAYELSFKHSALFAVTYAILVPIIGGDMFAYVFGKLIGGKKMCPTISPKKTIAGGVGGLLGAMTVSLLFWVIFEVVGGKATTFVQGCGYTAFISHAVGGYLWKSALIYLALGLICGVFSELGDLAASRIKRAIGIKDYGKIFPGHGGFMDRIDSVMYCLVVLFVALTLIYAL